MKVSGERDLKEGSNEPAAWLEFRDCRIEEWPRLHPLPGHREVSPGFCDEAYVILMPTRRTILRHRRRERRPFLPDEGTSRATVVERTAKAMRQEIPWRGRMQLLLGRRPRP